MQQSVKLVVGNWKMNGLSAALDEARALRSALEAEPAACRIALCPPATLVTRLAQAMEGGPIEVGGQDCSPYEAGAYTGDVSALMLADAGAGWVILGHSERRHGHGEDDALVARKAETARAAGLKPIVCVGETLEQFHGGRTLDVVSAQVRASVPALLAGQDFAVAYEPVWCIGSGLVPTTDQIAQAHAAVRAALLETLGEGGRAAPILYGGSVKGSNAAEICAIADVGGALVGGASMKAADFLPIIRAA